MNARRLFGAVGVLAALAGCASNNTTSSKPTTTTVAATAASACATPAPVTTVAYEHLPGVPANATRLDIHAPARACTASVVVWVHGGGYQIGDKAGQIADKVKLFNGRGELLVSVNHRLTEPNNPSSAHYPDHFTDVAAAVAWVHDNIAKYGGDPSRIALLGHSAGADIVSNVATNPKWLAAHGLPLSTIRCMGPFDTEGFDKPTGITRGDAEARLWKTALGNDPNYAVDTSAKTYVKSDAGIPPTITVVRGVRGRRGIEQAFVDQLSAAGIPTTSIDATSLTHEQVNVDIGKPGDMVMTAPLSAFLDRCFA
jgi:acetyl esterase/lipase